MMKKRSLLFVVEIFFFGCVPAVTVFAQRVSPLPTAPVWELQRTRLGNLGGGGIALSPDGKAVVYTARPESGRLYGGMFLLELESGKQTVLKEPDEGTIPSLPSFSPDGKTVVYVLRGPTSSYSTDIYSIGTDGSGLTKLTESQLYTDKPAYGQPGYTAAMYQRYYGYPQFSPDGSKILLSISDEVQRNQLTATMKPDGSDLRILAEGRPCCWSADGRAVYYYQRGLLTRTDVATRATRTMPQPSRDNSTPSLGRMAGREWISFLLDNGRIGWYNVEAPRSVPEFIGEWSVPGTKMVGAEELTLKGFEWSNGYDVLLWYQGKETERFEVVRIAEPATVTR